MIETKFKFTDEQIEEMAEKVFKKNAHRYKVQGFRDGKAPRKIIEQNYGPVFLEPAMDELFSIEYEAYLAKNPEIRPIMDPDVQATKVDGGLEIVAKIEVQEKFTLGKYMGLEIKGKTVDIGEKEIQLFLEKVQKDRTRQVAAEKDHKIKNGDIAVIDFVGSIDGVEFQGGTAQGHSLEIGSKSFIGDFEDQLVGKKVGDKIDVKVPFPKEYHAKDLAGKPALFKVEVKNILINQVPEIGDNLAKESSEFETLAEFKRDIKKRLEKQAGNEIEMANEDALISAVVANTKININPKLVENQMQHNLADLEKQLAQMEIDIPSYVQYIGMDMEAFMAQQQKTAEQRVHLALVLDAIMRENKLKDMDAAVKLLKKENKIC